MLDLPNVSSAGLCNFKEDGSQGAAACLLLRLSMLSVFRGEREEAATSWGRKLDHQAVSPACEAAGRPAGEREDKERARDVTNTARTAPWPQRFGTLKLASVKNGRKSSDAGAGEGAKFEQAAFGDKLVEAGAGAKVWFKGPIEAGECKNADGRTCTEDQMKIVYFKNNSAESDAEGSDEDEDEDQAEAETAGDTAAQAPGEAAPVAETDSDDIPF